MKTFDDFFLDIYGERWPQLREGLLIPERQVARLNLFSADDLKSKFSGQDFLPELSDCFWNEAKAISPQRTSEDLLDVYIMDPGSVFVAKALDAKAGDRILDMCAAPGGKTLILAQALKEEGEIFANDLSPERRERLKKVIQQYIPRQIRDRVWVRGQDGVQFGLREAESYDRILLDAPCSGERHLLENPQAMADWSPRRTEHLASRQYSLLAAALLAAKEGGRIVYSTCTISPHENDEIIRKLLKKKKNQIKLEEVNVPIAGAEKTEFGVAFMPDKVGFGPLYYSVLTKLSK